MKKLIIFILCAAALTLSACAEGSQPPYDLDGSQSSSSESSEPISSDESTSSTSESSTSEDSDSSPDPAASDDPLFVPDEPLWPHMVFHPTGIDAETDEILALIKHYSVFYYNYFYESGWIKTDFYDKSEKFDYCTRVKNVTAEQFFGKLNAYASKELAEKIMTERDYTGYLVENGALYAMPPGGAAGWGIAQDTLTLDSIKHVDDSHITVNFITHYYWENESGIAEVDENKEFSVKLVNTPDGLRVDECKDWMDLTNFGELHIGEKTYPF